MPVSGVTAGDPITEAWGDSVAAAIATLEAFVAGSGYYKPGGTDVPLVDGGTGASSAGTARGNLGLGPANVPAFAGVTFPSVDTPNAGANVLDAYEEGVFTPALALNVPGTSSWAVTTAVGWHTKIGNRVLFHFLYTAVLTKGSGSGQLNLSGFPYAASSAAGNNARYAAEIQGWARANYTGVYGVVNVGNSTGIFRLTGSGQSSVTLNTTDLTDGATVSVFGSGHYMTATPAIGATQPGPELPK